MRLGPSAVLNLAVAVLVANHLPAAAGLGYAAAFASDGVRAVALRRAAVAIAAATSGWSVWRRRGGVAPDDARGVYKYYMHLWTCFYVAYAWLPLAR